MNKTLLIYGCLLAAMLMLMRFIEYRFMVRSLSIEFYIGVVAFLFTGLGIWVGLKFTRKPQNASPSAEPTLIKKEEVLSQWRISEREYEVLLLIAQGHSNQEIADQLFVSRNTVKTHISNLFGKLEVSRRTQAISKAKHLGILE